MHLESDQLVAETVRPLARAHISRRTVALLWAMRVAVLLVSAIVIYVFIANL